MVVDLISLILSRVKTPFTSPKGDHRSNENRKNYSDLVYCCFVRMPHLQNSRCSGRIVGLMGNVSAPV